jgi:uncharacterized membrane protein YphA (DoxX/SURF4 family)
LVAAAVSIILGKLDKLASVLLALMLLLFAILVHGAGMSSGDEAAQAASMSNMLKDIGLAGAALMSASLSKDDSVIG